MNDEPWNHLSEKDNRERLTGNILYAEYQAQHCRKKAGEITKESFPDSPGFWAEHKRDWLNLLVRWEKGVIFAEQELEKFERKIAGENNDD